MKIIYLLSLSTLVGLCSCSSSRNTQSSDDSYYSASGRTTSSASGNYDEYYNANASDQYLRMRVENPAMWSTFDNYDYGYGSMYSPYMYGGYYNGISPYISLGYWNPYYSYMSGYFAWNSFYNPYFGTTIVAYSGYSSPGQSNNFYQLHPGLGAYAGTAYGTPTRLGLKPYSFTGNNPRYGNTGTNSAPNSNKNASSSNGANRQNNSFSPGAGSRSFGGSSGASSGGGRSFGRGGRP